MVREAWKKKLELKQIVGTKKNATEQIATTHTLEKTNHERLEESSLSKRQQIVKKGMIQVTATKKKEAEKRQKSKPLTLRNMDRIEAT
jgi:hypothetical protein